MHVKVLSCNIRRDMPQDNEAGDGWVHRRDLCANVIRGQNPDIVCFQECHNEPLNDLLDRLPEFQYYGLSNPGDAYNPTNVIFFSRERFPMISAGGFWLSETPHVAGSKSWDSKNARFVNWVDLQDGGTQFRVWNGHLDHIGEIARREQARLTVEGSQALPEDSPQLLTGDFNVDASDSAIAVLKAGGWIDTYTAVNGPDDPGHTFHGFIGPRFLDEHPNARVKGKMDFIFCRGPVRPLTAEIIRDGKDGRFPSDHYFVSAEVTL